MSSLILGKTGYRCIYCGCNIPPDIGLSCGDCTGSKKTARDEYIYADEIEPQVASMMQQIEANSDRVEGSAQTKEEAFRLHEVNEAARKEYQFPDQEEMKERRTGKILHMNQFLDKLKSTGVKAWYTETSGMEGTRGLYVSHDNYMSGCKHDHGAEHYVGFVQIPYMQEYEEWYFDDYNVPKGIRRRGWRTIGLRLIEQGIVTEQQFHRAFGEPVTGIVSGRYRAYLQYLRGLPR